MNHGGLPGLTLDSQPKLWSRSSPVSPRKGLAVLQRICPSSSKISINLLLRLKQRRGQQSGHTVTNVTRPVDRQIKKPKITERKLDCFYGRCSGDQASWCQSNLATCDVSADSRQRRYFSPIACTPLKPYSINKTSFSDPFNQPLDVKVALFLRSSFGYILNTALVAGTK